MMYRSLILCVLLFGVVVSSIEINNKYETMHVKHRVDMNASYGALANTLMTPALNLMNSAMSTLNATSLPPDVKLLRNYVLEVRNILDVFAFAYPPVYKQDVFLVAREDTNVGYTLIGEFKDLSDSHVNYTYKDMEKLRSKCLAWQTGYFNDSQKYDYPVYFLNTSTTQLFVRDSSDLSPYFWGATDNLVPTLNRTGYQNIAYLMRTLTSGALAKYNVFLNLTDIYIPATQLIFHGYRKLIRGIDSVSTFAMEIYKPNTGCVKDAIVETTALYTSIGKIEDQITAYNFYVEKKKQSKAAQQEVAITTMFTALKQWMATNRPDTSLLCLENSLIAS